MKINLFKMAGLISFSAGNWCLHLFCYPEHWVWFHEVEEYDKLFTYYGFGPLFLLVIPRWKNE